MNMTELQNTVSDYDARIKEVWRLYDENLIDYYTFKKTLDDLVKEFELKKACIGLN